jgi:glycosyltransferase involved in cell wall biosynthesis
MPVLVSIIIPCYNAEPWLAATLESALDQTWLEKEIIVVNNGSTDGSLATARQRESRGVIVIDQPNGGASAARNAGLRVAGGEFVQFLDADDLLAPDKIERQMQRLLAGPSRAIARGPWAPFHDRPAETRASEATFARDLAPVELLLIKASPQILIPSSSWLCPRAVLDAAGPWDESLTVNDDGEYFARVVAASAWVAWCDSAFVHYRQHHSGSLSRRSDRRSIESLYRSIERTDACLMKFEDSSRMRSALADQWSWLCYELYPDHADLSAQAARHARHLGRLRNYTRGRAVVRLASRLLGWRLVKRAQSARLGNRHNEAPIAAP